MKSLHILEIKYTKQSLLRIGKNPILNTMQNCSSFAINIVLTREIYLIVDDKAIKLLFCTLINHVS